MRKALAFSFVSLALLAAGCKHESNNTIYMPDMVYSPSFKAQEEGSMRKPPAGTLPRGFKPYAYATDPEGSSKDPNLLHRTKTAMLRGKKMFNVYCIVCHGPNGEGDGTIVPKFPRPPSLQSDKIRGYTDGRIYHVITRGQNLMPSYATQIDPQDRWAIIHYVRALQRAKHPTPDDLKRFEASLPASAKPGQGS